MNYKEILNEIKPTDPEIREVHEIADKSINYINKIAKKENINVEAILVGSIAKGTWLSGNSDIDIFINFPLEADKDYLKEKGLYLGYKCSEYMKGEAEEHYASHPYLTTCIEGYDIDFVPCYKIINANQLKSAVDRTVLHTKYIQTHLKDEKQKDEVLLLKKFMNEIGTYGSEFKVGGFAGYLCEMLILRYNTFEKTLKAASNWKNKTVIDLENYKTNKLFKDPLIAIDPTDKNRNVGAALTKQRMSEFIIASRNYLDSEDDKKIKFFHIIDKKPQCKNMFKQFKDRDTKTLTLSFDIPDVPADSLHPQLKKTQQSISEKLEDNDFSVFKSDYWTDEENKAIFIFELNVYKQNKYYIHEGPKIWDKKACDQFIASHCEDYYIIEDMLVLNKERHYTTAKKFIKNVLTQENIHIIKVGKNLNDLLINTCELNKIKKLLKKEKIQENNGFLNFLDDFLNPGQLLKR
ncbi:CCA-adding enzyme [Candidatus Methanobinarius endosymbioticus]|uniref:CCA-adding enzyme n=1 Tax=Candidatus Methanobinarius endosymbioticus TaxID=2006182 RepID=A0A366MFQ7_9EURY|nr:CCA-adding enzyme [Candidatus Methanobinarius endosymbioticus]